MKNFLLLLFVFVSALYSSAQTDLFFSEYVEGSGNNKALEIYNPTSQTIDLSKYSVARYSNGSAVYTEGGITQLTGTIAPYKTFVLVNGQTVDQTNSPKCSPDLQALGNQLDHAYPAPTYMNGNDAIALLKLVNNVLTPVDLIGQISLGAAISGETGWSYVKDTTVTYKNNTTGLMITGKVIKYIVQDKATDGSSFGPFWLAWTANHTLIRKPNIVSGVKTNPNPFIVNQQWDTVPAVRNELGQVNYENIWTELGKHTCVADPTTSIGKSVSSFSLTIFPNPIADRFTVTSQLPILELEIFSVIGQSVYKQAYAKGQQQLEIGALNLDKGMYLVKVTSSNKNIAVKKILIK